MVRVQISMLVGCALTAGCVAPEPAPAKIYASSHVPDVNLGPYEPRAGFHEHTVLVDGQPRQMGVWLPEGARSPHPLVVYLHGALMQLSTTDVEVRRVTMADQMLVAECLVEALAPLEPLVVIPQSSVGQGGQWWRESESEWMIGLIHAVKRTWPVEDRTALMGYSNGALGTWVLARLYPEHFQAAIPIAFHVGVVGEVAIPLFAIQGTSDELFGYTPIEREIQRLQRANQPITLRARLRGSHFRPCDYAHELHGAVEWLQARGW